MATGGVCCYIVTANISDTNWCEALYNCVLLKGVGYLNARGIIHKDLKSKNVFLEDGQQQTFKVVISDYGLFSVTKLCQGSR